MQNGSYGNEARVRIEHVHLKGYIFTMCGWRLFFNQCNRKRFLEFLVNCHMMGLYHKTHGEKKA